MPTGVYSKENLKNYRGATRHVNAPGRSPSGGWLNGQPSAAVARSGLIGTGATRDGDSEQDRPVSG